MKTPRKAYRRRGPHAAVMLLAGCRDRNYDEIIAAAFAGAVEFGSAANALATFARESPTFRRISASLAAEALSQEHQTVKRKKV